MLPRPHYLLLPLLAALPLSLLPSTSAQSAPSLTTVLQNHNLTIFSQLVNANPSLFTYKNNTILVPSDAAFSVAQQQLSNSGSVAYDIPSLLAYHQVVGTYSAQDMASAQQSNGEVLPTMLKNASQVNMGGVSNVVGVPSAMQLGETSTTGNGGTTAAQQQVALQGGLGMGANITLADLEYDGGLIQVLDKVLNLPDTCSKTLMSNNVTAFIQYLAKATMLVPPSSTSSGQPDPVGYYDNLTSITCFAPDNTAYAAQQPIYNSLDTQQISAAVGWHIFRGVFYGSETPSGSVLVPMWGNGTRGFVFERNASGMWIGGSRLVRSDWMIKNGVVHILDKPLNMTESVPVNSSTPTFSGYGGPLNGTATGSGVGPSQTGSASGALGGRELAAWFVSVAAFGFGGLLSVL